MAKRSETELFQFLPRRRGFEKSMAESSLTSGVGNEVFSRHENMKWIENLSSARIPIFTHSFTFLTEGSGSDPADRSDGSVRPPKNGNENTLVRARRVSRREEEFLFWKFEKFQKKNSSDFNKNKRRWSGISDPEWVLGPWDFVLRSSALINLDAYSLYCILYTWILWFGCGST